MVSVCAIEEYSCKLNLMRVLSFLFIILTLVSCEKGPHVGPGDDQRLASAAQNDCGYVQNLYGERVSWKMNIPVTLKRTASYPAEFNEVLDKAVQHWNDAAGLVLLRVIDDSADATKAPSKDAKNTIHWMQEWSDSQSKVQALTDLAWRGGQLYEADVRVNAKDFSYFISEAKTPYDIHLESLLIHELGHVLGLKHRSTVPSVMWSVLNGASIRSTLSSADKESLKCEY